MRCVIGLTIYPGSTQEKSMYQEAREIGEEAKANGLAAGPLVVPARLRGQQAGRDCA